MLVDAASLYFGYFDRPNQDAPTYDPGMAGGKCLLCGNPLARPVKTISLMRDGDSRSYFYRAHKACYEGADAATITQYESALIDAPLSSEPL
ncbi:MAG: hypothetical protein KME45_03350 [Stenomitos rutilans HA7619-LM2]|jgi:hypothetical protein|nr:hypothetical protein [Stenomitos rutilans HA7619-LM2]MBW4469421.1 hypothetical protein [Stenomitos rutilans HA7619-LM2]